MTEVSNPKIRDLKGSKYMSLKRLTFVKNKKKCYWDVCKNFDHVCILLFHSEKNSLLLCQQFRPPLLYRDMRYSSKKGKKYVCPSVESMSPYELCAGLIDKKKDIYQTAVEEIEEECGFKVTKDRLVLVNEYFDVGTSGKKGFLFYCEVSEEDRVSEGGGLESENEIIEVIEVKLEKIFQFIEDKSKKKSCSLLFGLYWFIAMSGLTESLDDQEKMIDKKKRKKENKVALKCVDCFITIFSSKKKKIISNK